MGYKAELEALVLGALRDGPLHGYLIAQAIRRQSEGALKMGDNQIYPTLHRLEAEGLVTADWEIQTGKPSRKVYSLTHSGSTRLEEHRKSWQAYSANFMAVLGRPEAGNA